MRVTLTVLSVILAVSAYDSVLFSNEKDVTSLSVEDVLSAAGESSPVVFIVNPDFTLGQFSRKVNAYSEASVSDYLATAVKSSKFHASKFFAEQLAVTAKTLTNFDDFTSGQSVYIVAGEEWSSAESLAQQVLAKLGDNVIVVLTATDALTATSRVKRVATDAMREAAASANSDEPLSTGAPSKLIDFPLVIPPYNISEFGAPKTSENLTCLFYLEGLTVVVQQKLANANQYLAIPIRLKNATWGVSDNDWACTKDVVGPYTFRVYLKANGDLTGKKDSNTIVIPSGSIIDLTLTFKGAVNGYWSLSQAQLNQITIKGGGSFESVSVSGASLNGSALNYLNIGSYIGFAYACHETQAFFFPSSNANVKVGIALYNAEVQTIANYHKTSKWIERAFFTRQVSDCVGTFSPGSWMGLLSALVMISGLMFGYVMLQSVQTQDKFDDPKQRQIVINVRE